MDFNDNPPVWRQDSYSCRVSAEAQPGHVVISMSASDPDTGQIMPLRYAIHSGDRNGIFKIDPLTGKKQFYSCIQLLYGNFKICINC